MGWRPNMTPEQRDRLNASRRRRYARERIRAGKSYTPKSGQKAPPMEPRLNLPTLSTEEALAIIRRVEEEEGNV